MGMFFRTKTVRGTPVLQRVESFRNPEGLPRQRVLASLGDASVPADERGAIAKAVELRSPRKRGQVPGASAWQAKKRKRISGILWGNGLWIVGKTAGMRDVRGKMRG